MLKSVKRGQIYFAELPETRGSEQRGTRPVLVIQNDVGNRRSSTTLIAPLTSRVNKKRLSTHVSLKASENDLKCDSIVLLEQSRVIDKSRLRNYVTFLDESKMSEINVAILVSFGIAA